MRLLQANRGKLSAVHVLPRKSSLPVCELLNAAASGDIRKVLQLLDNGLNVNVSFPPDESEFSGMTVVMAENVHSRLAWASR